MYVGGSVPEEDQESQQRPAQPPSTQPPVVDVPSGQYFAEGSIDWENGPRPLLLGDQYFI